MAARRGDGAALDPAVLENLRQLNQEGQPDIVREVLTVFLSDAPLRVAAIEEAVKSADPAWIHRAAPLKACAAR